MRQMSPKQSSTSFLKRQSTTWPYRSLWVYRNMKRPRGSSLSTDFSQVPILREGVGKVPPILPTSRFTVNPQAPGDPATAPELRPVYQRSLYFLRKESLLPGELRTAIPAL